MKDAHDTGDAIAIVGMAGRFPDADSPAAFWENLKSGHCSIQKFSAEDLVASGEDPAQLVESNYVSVGAPLDGADTFDAAFFGIPPNEARLMDPQHRVFLECAWSALEDAGYDPASFDGLIGVFGGVGRNTYLLENYGPYRKLMDAGAVYEAMLGSEKDFPATRVSFKLNLRGPSINVQSACSTSGVAIHLACQSLLNGECDLALAGGARIRVPLRAGYRYVEGGIASPDGFCRAFDAQANGCVYGNGAGMVVLKRLDHALEDGDSIHALIRATALNNDGSDKVGFTAPSVSGQAAVIREALAMSGVNPETIGLVEAHGTGTNLGDPIEIAALTRAYREFTDKSGYCAIGSLKTNIGHLDAGAGVTGLIKAALSMRDGYLPPSLHFNEPNPQIDFANSPFFVNTELREWPRGQHPRRAAVSSFGLGGTNFHAILEEAPSASSGAALRPLHLLPLSARSEEALDVAAQNLARHLREHPTLNLADVAFTLGVGRRAFEHRRFAVVTSTEDAIAALEGGGDTGMGGVARHAERPVAFMFPGGGAQYPGMARGLYANEPAFAKALDRCLELLPSHLVDGVRELLRAEGDAGDAKRARAFERPSVALPALFAVEYALSELWASWGLEPAALIGHSLGEYTAACVGGVLSSEDALALVVERGRLFEKIQPGAMLSVALADTELAALGVEELSVAAINRPEQCVVAGSNETIRRLEEILSVRNVDYARLHISVAAHSTLVEPILDEFGEFAGRIRPSPPSVPIVSNVSGTWMTDEEALDRNYWVRHLRQTVRFSAGIETLFQDPDLALMEVGPGQTLATFARQHPKRGSGRLVASSVRHPKESVDDLAFLMKTLGRCWLAGVSIDWKRFYGGEKRRRVGLPTYPFERKRFWLESAPTLTSAPQPAVLPRNADATPVPAAAALATEASVSTATGATDRKPTILATIKSLLYDLSGIEPDDLGAELTFLELGFDSLFLTRANGALQAHFGITIGFRELFEDLSTPAKLAEYIDAQLPPDPLPSVTDSPAPTGEGDVPAAPPPPNLDAAPPDAAFALIARQLDVITEQLRVLHAWAPGAAATAETTTVAPSREQATYEHLGGTRSEVSDERSDTLVPLTDSQREIWLAAAFSEEGSCAFNLCYRFDLRGVIDPSALRRALDLVAARHEALRMCAEPDGSAVRISSSVAVEFDVQDLSRSERLDALERIDERARAEWTTPFDLSAAPLIRAQLLVLDEESAALLLTLHHFVCDGFSIQTITDDLCAYYDGALHGTEVSRPNAMQYGEYARWQEAERTSNEYRAAEAFYVERFREPPPFLELPLDRPRPPLLSFRCAELHDRLEPALVDRLRELGNSRQASFFSTLLASVNVWLHQLSRETDLVTGISLAGQTIVGHDELVGHCVNLHPFRTALLPDESFEALLARVQGGMLDVFQHRNYTYGALLEKIQVPRQANRAPLVAVHFNFESEIATRKGGEFDIEISTVPRSYHTQELALNFSLDEQGILIKCWHNVDLYDSKSVRQWLEAYREIAAAIADRPESDIASLCAATWGSTRSLLEGLSDPTLPRETAAGLVAAQVERTPDMPALESGPNQLTYREMDERVRALTSALSEAGVRPGDLVGIALERSADLAVAMQAVWRAGGAYLPLDPEFPGDRLAFMLEDSGTGVVISQRSVESRLPDGFSGTVVLLDEVDWAVPAVFPSVAPSAEDRAYVIYTSGSTGKPKGVEITQGSVANFLQSMQHEPGCEPGDRLLGITTLSFDISVLELVLPLTRGGCVVVATAEDLRDGPSLAAAIERADPTIMQATPATWRMLFDSGWPGDEKLTALCGGEALLPDLAQKLSAVVKQAWNMYGPTEATIWSSCHLIPASDEPVLIGLPIANTQIHILDDRGQPAPLGIPGEIYIGGAGLAGGYLHRPELNAERFVEGPGPEHDRLYRTGDVGRVTVDGQLEYLHRADDQLKLRGFRIEPGEVEAALLEHESVRDVAVAARGDAQGELRLVAYVVFDADDPPTVSELRRFARGKLPRYMVPGLIVELDALPLTPNGKVDRRALPDPLARKREDVGRTTAQTSTERLLSEVWTNALGTQDIAREDNFFELGGHSLSAMRVVFEIERRTDKQIDPRLMFFQSLEQIAAGLDFEPAVAS